MIHQHSQDSIPLDGLNEGQRYIVHVNNGRVVDCVFVGLVLQRDLEWAGYDGRSLIAEFRDTFTQAECPLTAEAITSIRAVAGGAGQ